MEPNSTETQYDLMEHLLRLTRTLRRRPADENHISHGTQKVLGVLLQQDGLPTTQLAEKLDIRPSSLTDLLRRMEEADYLRRQKDDSDSRVWRVFLTDKARRDYAQREAKQQEQGQRLANSLSPEEVAAFCATCDKLCAFLEAEYPERAHHHGPHGPNRPHRGRGGVPKDAGGQP